MAEQVKNSLDNPTSTLAAGITSGALSLTVASGHGARLPATGDFRLKLTDQSDDTLYELVVGTARSSDVVTVTRAAEGTTARAFVTGDHVDLVLSAAALTAYVTENSAADADVTASTAASVILAPAASARNVIQPTVGSVIAAVVKAHAAQSVDLTQWQNSAGAVLARFTSGGRLSVSPAVLADETAAAEFHSTSDLAYAASLFADDVSAVAPQIILWPGGYPAIILDHGLGFGAGALSSAAVLMRRKGLYDETVPSFAFGMEADSDSAGRAYMYSYSPTDGAGYAWNIEWPDSQIVLGTIATSDIPGRVNIRGYGTRTTEHMLDIKAIASFAADYVRARDSAGALVFRVNKSGIPMLLAHAAPADGDLSSGEHGQWFDQTNGAAKWMAKGKTANGTVVTWEFPSGVAYVAGGTDVAVADGGTGASTAAGARTNLGLVIGTDVPAFSVSVNTQTASYGLVLADAGKVVEMNVGSANNLTVPLNATQAFPIGTVIELHQYGAGQTTVVATGGVTIRSPGGKLKLTGQYSSASLRKRGTDEWTLAGDIAA